MTPCAARGKRTGRADRIVAWLDARPGHDFSTAEIASRACPGDPVNNVSATLAGLVNGNRIVRIKRATHSRFTSTIKPAAAAAKRNDPALQPARNRHAYEAADALTGIPRGNQVAREQIAADTAAFLKAGGKIERLGPTQFFKHDNIAANDDYTVARARSHAASRRRYQE